MSANYDFFSEEAIRVNANGVAAMNYKQNMFETFMEADRISSYVNNLFIIESINENKITESGIWQAIKKIFEKIALAITTVVDKIKGLFSKNKKVVKQAEEAAKAGATDNINSEFEYVNNTRSDMKNALDLVDAISQSDAYDYAKNDKNEASEFAKWTFKKIGYASENRWAQVAEKVFFNDKYAKVKGSEIANSNVFKVYADLEAFVNQDFPGKKRKVDAEVKQVDKNARQLMNISKAQPGLETKTAQCIRVYADYCKEIIRGVSMCMTHEYKQLTRIFTVAAASYTKIDALEEK